MPSATVITAMRSSQLLPMRASRSSRDFARGGAKAGEVKDGIGGGAGGRAPAMPDCRERSLNASPGICAFGGGAAMGGSADGSVSLLTEGGAADGGGAGRGGGGAASGAGLG